MYSYGYGSGLGSLGSLGNVGAYVSALVILSVVALVAAIVVAVVFYRKYVAAPRPAGGGASNRSNWGPFFRFDRLIIYNVNAALYIFGAAYLLFQSLAFVLSAIALGVAAFFVNLIVCAVVCVLGELGIRVSYETKMLLVRITRDTNAIKNQECGTDDPDPFVKAPAPVPVPPAGGYGYQQPYQPQQPAGGGAWGYGVGSGQPPYQPQQPQGQQPQGPESAPFSQQGPSSYDSASSYQPFSAPEPPASEPAAPAASAGSGTCPVCGAPLHPGDTFCRQCGTKLS